MVALALYGAEVKTRSVQHCEIYTEESKEFQKKKEKKENFKIMNICKGFFTSKNTILDGSR